MKSWKRLFRGMKYAHDFDMLCFVASRFIWLLTISNSTAPLKLGQSWSSRDDHGYNETEMSEILKYFLEYTAVKLCH